MGNNGDAHAAAGLGASQQVQQSHSNGRQRLGLMPTDGQDAYKRASTRNSRRSRAERTSYLMATGHLNIEETEQLNKPSSNDIAPIGLPHNQQIISTNSKHTNRNTSGLSSSSDSRQNYEQTLLEDYHNISFPPSQRQFDSFQQENIFGRSKQGNSFKKHTKQLRSKISTNDNNNRGKFRQTYTEVTLPMKTSPAFEYILKDNKRRNRRCCLWLLYSSLVTICIAIIVFCSVHLILRYQN